MPFRRLALSLAALLSWLAIVGGYLDVLGLRHWAERVVEEFLPSANITFAGLPIWVIVLSLAAIVLVALASIPTHIGRRADSLLVKTDD